MDITKKRLAIITTHPIQYNAPFFKLLSERNKISIKIFYTWSQSKNAVYDPDFKNVRQWDIPLLDGYEYEFVENISKTPGSNNFNGIINPNIIECVNLFSPDAVLVYGWAFASHLKVMRHYKNKIPVFFRGDSTLIDEPEGFSFKKIFRTIFLKWIYSFVDIAFYTGTYNKNYFYRAGLKEEQLIFAPHAIENERFFLNETIKDQSLKLRYKLNIGEEDIVFLFAGKFHQKKNPLLLLTAFLKMNDKNVHLVFVGNGELESALKNLSKNNHKVHFIPFRNQSIMPAVYHLCNIFILPSQGPGETWGLALNEAMAAGKAVIASNKTGGATDLIKPNLNGHIFVSGDKNALASYMHDVINTYVEMGNQSLKIIKELTIEKFAAAIEIKMQHV
ncbi:hypothetical protein BH09BAC2_BH09BAC2_15750 [soil metagenome]